MMKNKYIPVRKLTQITEERFKYLMNTLPWNLSKEDQAEATQLKREVQPLLDTEMEKLLDKYKGCDDVFDDFNNEIESKRKEAIFYLEKSIRAGERMKTIFNGGDNARKLTP